MTSHVKLREFYENSQEILIPVIPTVFIPDGWTRAFASGLSTQVNSGAWAGKHVLEVGVGSFINGAGIMTSPNAPKQFTGIDITDDSVSASRELIVQNNIPGDILILKEEKFTDVLVVPTDERIKNVSKVVACIPQVPMTEEELAAFDKNVDGGGGSHAYIPDGNHEEWEPYGLGLNARLLEESAKRIPEAEVILNLCGRPSRELLQDFFDAHGRQAEFLHEEMVSQHPGTDLTSLAQIESKTGRDFEFFANRAGTEKLTASQAEERRGKQPVFHKIYVVKGSAPGLKAA